MKLHRGKLRGVSGIYEIAVGNIYGVHVLKSRWCPVNQSMLPELSAEQRLDGVDGLYVL
ncbi:MAG: hypothetical protein QOE33_3706 [Acidobacteriota bacterium]|nr:hypothetical protein [Acidobacteriota bacterium]